MTKNDLVAIVAKKTGISAQESTRVTVDAVFESITEILSRGESLEIRGFGTLKVLTRKARPARLIKEGKTIMLPEGRKVKFIPGKEIKKCLASL